MTYKKNSLFLIALVILGGCVNKETSHDYTSVKIDVIFEDSFSIRAIEFLDSKPLAFAGSNGIYGSVNLATKNVLTNQMKFHTSIPSFRAIAHTATDFFMLSIENPALLYKTGDKGRMELVYKEEGDGVFYDAMKFMDNNRGIAVGDSQDGCLSIIITKDGGQTWKKLACEQLPEAEEGEGAFAASNTNIEIIGETIWIGTTSGSVYRTNDLGDSWQKINTPILSAEPTQGIYSMDFYNESLGFAIGGDYTKPEALKANKIMTRDGGQTWSLIADGAAPSYKSCVQFIPNSGGQDLVALGFTGISYSGNGGHSWKTMSEEGFYTIRFLNDSIAYAAGKNRIAKLSFK
ncbi:MAG: oxidoreductase [Croceitalea sp.]|nr:oxidoreductase [Croceitalea sp.]